MGVQRKQFRHTGFKKVKREVDVGVIRTKMETKVIEERQDLEEVLLQVEEFVNGIGRARVINICEHGELVEQGTWRWTTIVVWYWDA